MTKQNRFYLLIATLSATVVSSNATAVCCDDCDSSLQDTWADLKNGGWYLGDSDLSEGDLCNVWDCGSAQDCGAVCGPEEATNGCLCVEVNEGLLANQICNGDSTCAAWLRDSSCGDDNPSGSDGYIGGSDSPTPSWNCDNGYYHEEGGSGCTECPPYTDYDGYDFTIESGNGRDAIIDCFVPAGKISHTFTDRNNNTYTISIDTDCYYDE